MAASACCLVVLAACQLRARSHWNRNAGTQALSPHVNNTAIMYASHELLVSLRDVQEAAARVAPWVHTTPVS